MASFSKKISNQESMKAKEILQNAGYSFDNAQYAIWRAKKSNLTITMYTSGKILVQGGDLAPFFALFPKYEENQQPTSSKQSSLLQDDTLSHNFESWIGIDESGKGDYFGPLVVASVLVEPKNIEILSSLGLKDSKKLSDENISKLAIKIKNNAVFSIIVINPEKYNQLYSQFGNLNKMLAWGHARAIENILAKTNCNNAISDKFGNENLIKNALLKSGKNINLIQQVRAERDLAVAAASILARDEFVKRIDNLSSKYQIKLYKGASNLVLEQAKLAKAQNIPLNCIAKLHFKTTQSI